MNPAFSVQKIFAFVRGGDETMVTQCAYCGRPLKNPKSQTEGIGPVCKRKGVDRAEIGDKHEACQIREGSTNRRGNE